jgi:hypothetical protein
MDPLGDLVAVLLAERERPEDQELEGALEQIGGRADVLSHIGLREVSPERVMGVKRGRLAATVWRMRTPYA